MAKKKAVQRKTRAIITGYLEKVSAQIFDKYQKEITEMIKGHQGLYALYRKNKLYYVGLASNLKNRIKHHLNDKHQGKWTHFSLYIIRHEDHIKELESLLLRIAYPEGNSQRGKLRTTNNLLPQLKKQVKRKIHEEYESLFKGTRGGAKKKTVKKNGSAERPLKGKLRKYQRIYATYKGYEYKAKVLPNGTIELVGSKERFDTPSGAGKAIIGTRSPNGWRFWKYKNEAGELVWLAALLK